MSVRVWCAEDYRFLGHLTRIPPAGNVMATRAFTYTAFKTCSALAGQIKITDNSRTAPRKFLIRGAIQRSVFFTRQQPTIFVGSGIN